MTIWVVVADAAKARFFSQETLHGQLTEVMDLAHPEARQSQTNLASDGPGNQSTAGGHGIHGMQDKITPREAEDQRFAREVIGSIREAVNSGKISSFYMAAPPRFLGRLRDAMDSRLSKALAGDLGKNISLASPEKVRSEFSI